MTASSRSTPKPTPPAIRTPSNPRNLQDLPFPLPKPTPAAKRRAKNIVAALRQRYPDAHCELNYNSPFQLLIATILSAQATDAGVNKATPALFKAYPDAKSLAAAEPEDLHPYIQSIGLYRNKAKSIVATARSLVENFDAKVPSTMDELLTLRGVARKTANVVLGNAFGINDGFVVDTHIERLAKRFALAPEDASTPMVERWLCALIPREDWCDMSHMLIFHGRRACKARGGTCPTDPICQKYCSNAKARA
ncbi:MAG: endonuclease III [Phycisphaerales bacterium]